MELQTASFSGSCPVCEAVITPAAAVEESEILACPDCQSRLVVDALDGRIIRFEPAPRVEEDWGE